MSCGKEKFIGPDGEPITWKDGDTLPEIGFVLPNGEAVADYTITLYLERPDGTVAARPAVDLGGSEGKFTWAADSLQAGKNQRAEIHRIDAATDELTTDVFLIDVAERVGP